MIDTTDRKLLAALQRDARVSNAELARMVGLAPSAVFERVKKLEQRGLIAGYAARLDPRALGASLLAYVFVRSDEHAGKLGIAKRLAAIPEVQEVHHVAGEDCYLIKVRTANTESLGALLREKIGAFAAVRSTRTTIVLDTVKETLAIPVPAASKEGRRGRR
ncbi:MAG: Lrp/AsnC family transcriptional regulator [Gemmatimonadaceae bacterium]